MTITEKQLEANRRNALKGGVKTAAGKMAVRHNALKHGLLAREVVIIQGEGAEDPLEFEALLTDLQNELQPAGTIEEMLVEKIAASYWRLRRSHRYETGLIREQLDSATDNFYNATDWNGNLVNGKESKLEQKIEEAQEAIQYWQQDKRDISIFLKEEKPLEILDEWEENWHLFFDEYRETLDKLEIPDFMEFSEVRQYLLTQPGWTEKRIWKAFIKCCENQIKKYRSEIDSLKKELAEEKVRNELKLQVKKKTREYSS